MAPSPTFNTKSPTIKRILREASEMTSSPSKDYHAAPLDSNLFEWHFTLRGPPTPSPFANGMYHGRIVLPPTYPLRPPSFRFLTPSGRFEVNREICLSISGFHEETWQPAWGVRTALVALRSFMMEDAKGQVGGLESGDAVRRAMAGESGLWRCGGCGGRTNREILEEQEELARKMEEEGREGKDEEKVPEELKLGYREDIERKDRKDAEGASCGETGASGPNVAHSPAGEVSAPGDALSAQAQSTFLDSEPPIPQEQPLPPAPQPQAATIPAPVQVPVTPNQAQPPIIQPQPTQHQQLAPVPTANSWIDLAIVGIAVMLGAMVVRKLLLLNE